MMASLYTRRFDGYGEKDSITSYISACLQVSCYNESIHQKEPANRNVRER